MFTFFTQIRYILLEFTLNSLCSERIHYLLTMNWISFWQIHYEFIIFLRINYKFFIFCAKRSIIAFTNSLLIHYFYAISSRIHFLFCILTINLLPPLQILDAFIIIPSLLIQQLFSRIPYVFTFFCESSVWIHLFR